MPYHNGIEYQLMNRDGRYYFRIKRPDGSRTTAKSTRATNKRAAEQVVRETIDRLGIAVSSGRVRLRDHATGFFDPAGPYVTGRRERGYSYTTEHALNQDALIRNYIEPDLGDRYLDEITSAEIDRWLMELYRSERCGARVINRIHNVLSVLFKEAVRERLIGDNPMDRVDRVKESPKDRGILTREELRDLLFSEDALVTAWGGDERYHLIAMLGFLAGMRSGEIRALQPQNVHPTWIDISQSWHNQSGLGAPKWNHGRIAVIPIELSNALRELADRQATPPNGFIFRSPRNKSQPITGRQINLAFKEALGRIGIDEAEIKRRNLVFHSTRHTMVSMMRGAKIDLWQSKNFIGHADDRTHDNYSHARPEDLKDVVKFQSKLMGAPLVKRADS